MREQRNLIGFPIPGSEGDVLTTRSTSYGLNLSGSWELGVWGRIRSGQKAAGAEAGASAADLASARLSLAAQTVKAWAAAIEAGQQVSLARSTVDSYRVTAGQVRKRYEEGLRSPLDLRLALASLAGAEALLEARQIAAKNTLRQLEILLGRYPSGAVNPGDTLPVLEDTIPVGLPSELVARRPDLAAARQRLLAADWRVSESKAALLPRLSLTAGGGTATEDLSDLLDTDFKVWNIAANLAQPILEGGRLRAGVDLSRARTRQALAEYRGAVIRAFGEVENALTAESHLAKRESDLAEASAQSSAALRLARLRYQTGLDNFITVLESQRRALEAETALVSVRRERLDNRVNLHLALGGGFPTEVPPARDSQASAPFHKPVASIRGS
jgi:NodT family efflux transporter outer membrane factor (OMF) lipoprotein